MTKLQNSMQTKRHAEIVGGGFAGLAAAGALAQKGWSVRLHERAPELRPTGAGIYIYENGLRVLEKLGAYDEAVKGAPFAHTREMRDEQNRVLSVHRWDPSKRVFSVVRQRVINAMADEARKNGVEIVLGSEAAAATPDGELIMADGRRLKADLVVAGDGINSRIRDSLNLIAKRRPLPDGAVRIMIDRTPEERAASDGGTTIENWSGSRRILYTPVSDTEVYIALTMLHSDEVGRRVPIERASWKQSFPHLSDLIDRFVDNGQYGRFEYIRLKSWSAGRVVILGDAAHALPPNIGQGAGCSMMNALSLAYYLDREKDMATALKTWETNERPMTEHTQRISVFLGLPTTWPTPMRRAFLTLAGKSKWMVAQRTKTARHIPTGT
jgi:2-polyprenyl-6-methoxyphenol hydroxylase-like FAD-dependent oxidoreductase